MTYRVPGGGRAFDVILNGTNLEITTNTFTPATDANVGTSVPLEDVHTADGYPRNFIEINGQFPGPTIEVLEGAEVSHAQYMESLYPNGHTTQ